LRCNKFKVNVTFKDTGKRTSFTFSNSHNDWENGVTTLEGNNLKWAFQCFLGDAVSADQTFESFCSDFGYDVDSRNAYKIYQACEKSFNKLEKILDNKQFYKAYNYLIELENNNWQVPEPESEEV
jgi:hypothetical protein